MDTEVENRLNDLKVTGWEREGDMGFPKRGEVFPERRELIEN